MLCGIPTSSGKRAIFPPKQQLEQTEQQLEQTEQQLEQERLRSQALAERLRALGVDPDQI